MGLLDFMQTPEGQGLLAATFGGLAGARKGAPINSLGRAGLAGLQGYSGAIDQQSQQADRAVQNRYRDMQMSQMQQQLDQQNKRQQGVQSFVNSINPTAGAEQPDVRTSQFYNLLKNGLIDPVEYIKSTGPKDVEIKDYKEVRGADGSVSIVGLTKDGKTVNTNQTPFIKPEVRDFGGKIQGIDLINGKLTNYGDKTMTPGEIASNKVALGNLGVSRQRLAFDQGQVPNASVKGAPAGYKWRENGNLVAIPGGPADAKAQALAQQKSVGVSDVDLAISTLRDAYNRLEKGGGITSTNNGMLSNIGASASASSLGQVVGKALGTDNQSARNDISMTRPALLAALMKATGMSAKQMDSNAELKMWMATATDPALDVESNRRALDKIEKKYLGATDSQPPEGGSDLQSAAAEELKRRGK